MALRFSEWADNLVAAVKQGNPTHDAVIQAIRINDIVLASVSVEAFFQTGQAVKAKSPFEHTQFLGYSNGCVAYLPRAEDYPPGGWKIDESYAVPDLMAQSYALPVAFEPGAEQMVVERVLDLIQQLVE